MDNDANINNYNYFESYFTNLKRYDYGKFWEDFSDKDSPFHDTLHLLHEISNKLMINRLKSWWIIWYKDEDRRLYLWEKNRKSIETYSEKISHGIIESFMVLANTITWRYFVENDVQAIYKNHLNLDERSFYSIDRNGHVWLWVTNYTHFTSPIRRYVDIVIHRIIKCIERGDELPYTTEDLKFIAKHSNNTRLKIEVIWSQMFFEIDWNKYLKRVSDRLWKEPKVYDIKEYIRNSVSNGKKMPNCMKEAIKTKIETTPVWDWWWAIWVILFWKDIDLKIFLKDHILNWEKLWNNSWPLKILNLIVQTQLLKWDEFIFDMEEIETENEYKLTVKLHWNKMASYASNPWKLWDMNYIKWFVRNVVLEKVFSYFINL